MRKFKIVKTYKYTTEAIIEAECYDDAKAFVDYELIEEEINHDDWLHDYTIREISGE